MVGRTESPERKLESEERRGCNRLPLTSSRHGARQLCRSLGLTKLLGKAGRQKEGGREGWM